MGDYLKSVCAVHGFAAVTVSFNTCTTYQFSAFIHRSSGEVGHGTGDTIEAAVEAGIGDLRQRFPEAA